MPFGFKKIAVHVFILLHLFIIAVWSLPTEMKFKSRVEHIFSPYFYFTGLWQGWDMFAPNPRSTKLRMDAYVYYEDGSRRTWEFPQMEKLSYLERFQKERFRKWAHDNVRMDSSSRLWKPTAEYISRLLQEPGNPIKKIELNRHWYELTLEEENRELASSDWQHYTFYTYEFPEKK